MFKTIAVFTCLILVISTVDLQAQCSIKSFNPASGSIGSIVTITGSGFLNSEELTIGGVSAISVRKTDTTLVAMIMTGTVSGCISIKTLDCTVNSPDIFFVTQSQPPVIQQGDKLVGTGNTFAANQGYSVSLSADGNTAIVGGDGDNNGQGAVWIFVRDGDIWTQQGGKLVGSGTIDIATQGVSVSLSADGNTAIVGGYYDDSRQGAVWIFTRNNDVWTQQGSKLVGSGSIGTANLGYSVSLSADGNTAIAGGYYDNSGHGAAWIFIRNGDVWTQQGDKLVGLDNIGAASQGYSVSLSADGNTAIVGGYNDNDGTGAAWVFTRCGSNWTQQGDKLVGSGYAGVANQGYSVSLSADGNTAIVGGFNDNDGQGAIWIFRRFGKIWTQQGNKLVGTGDTDASSYQGKSVSLSADGNTALFGGSFDNSLKGAAWVFIYKEGVWLQKGDKLVGSGSVGFPVLQGHSVSLSADGNTAMVGGLYDNSGQGAVWAYARGTVLPVTLLSFTADRVDTVNRLKWTLATESNCAGFEIERSADNIHFNTLFFVPCKYDNDNGNTLLDYVYDDTRPLPGDSYYRLKQRDKDGKSVYSFITLVKRRKSVTFLIDKIYPNPSVKELSVIVDAPYKNEIVMMIYDELGRMIFKQNAVAFEGKNNYKLNVSNLLQGIYLLKVQDENGINTDIYRFLKK